MNIAHDQASGIDRVLVVVESLGRGGAEEAIRRIATELNGRGIHCTVAHLFGPDTLAAEIAATGAEVRWLGARSIAGLPLALTRLARLERELRPDVAHSHLYFAAIAAALSGLRPSAAPRVLTLHGIDYFNPSGSWRRRLRRAAHGWALRRHRLTAVSADVAAHFVREFGVDEPLVIANPVVELPAREGPGTAGLIVCPARLVREKRHDRLLRGVESMRRGDSGQEPRLVLAGEGRERPRIEEQVRALGLQDSVELRGELDQESVLALIREARVVAMTSDYEGFGIGVADAMALGVPVVVTRVPGLREVAGGSDGAILVEPDDDDALATALAETLDAERSIEMGRIAREDALRQFAPAPVVDELLACFAAEVRDRGR